MPSQWSKHLAEAVLKWGPRAHLDEKTSLTDCWAGRDYDNDDRWYRLTGYAGARARKRMTAS